MTNPISKLLNDLEAQAQDFSDGGRDDLSDLLWRAYETIDTYEKAFDGLEETLAGRSIKVQEAAR